MFSGYTINSQVPHDAGEMALEMLTMVISEE